MYTHSAYKVCGAVLMKCTHLSLSEVVTSVLYNIRWHQNLTIEYSFYSALLYWFVQPEQLHNYCTYTRISMLQISYNL